MAYNSDFEIRLAQLGAMGGDMTRNYNSVYDIDLEILRLTEEGSGGGGVTEDDVQEMIDAGLEPILVKEGETYTQDLADALAELGTDRAKWCERVYFCLSDGSAYYRCALFMSSGYIGGAFCFQGNAFMISFRKKSQHVGNAITFMKAELANKMDLPASTDPIKFYIGQTLTQDMYDKIWAITDSTEFARRMVLRENPAMINIFNWIPACALVNQNERYVQYYRYEAGYVRFIEINFKHFQVGSTITAETSQSLAWLNNIPTIPPATTVFYVNPDELEEGMTISGLSDAISEAAAEYQSQGTITGIFPKKYKFGITYGGNDIADCTVEYIMHTDEEFAVTTFDVVLYNGAECHIITFDATGTVSSFSMSNITDGCLHRESLTQSEYDAKSEAGTLDENTLYIITDAE